MVKICVDGNGIFVDIKKNQFEIRVEDDGLVIYSNAGITVAEASQLGTWLKLKARKK